MGWLYVELLENIRIKILLIACRVNVMCCMTDINNVGALYMHINYSVQV